MRTKTVSRQHDPARSGQNPPRQRVFHENENEKRNHAKSSVHEKRPSHRGPELKTNSEEEDFRGCVRARAGRTQLLYSASCEGKQRLKISYIGLPGRFYVASPSIANGDEVLP